METANQLLRCTDPVPSQQERAESLVSNFLWLHNDWVKSPPTGEAEDCEGKRLREKSRKVRLNMSDHVQRSVRTAHHYSFIDEQLIEADP